MGGQPQQAPDFPAHWPLAWNIPYKRNPFFTGRAQLLEKLRTQLVSGAATALTQAQAIAGLGGIGKTQTAVEYAYSHRQRYRYILWIGADKPENLLTNYAALAPLLNITGSDEKDTASVARRVRDYLAQQKDWLLIFDNADDVPAVQNYLPGGTNANGHILLTTRAQTAGSIARTIEVKELDRDEGTLLLLRRSGVLAPNAELAQATPEKRAEAEILERELGSLPLALDQAGAYIEETRCGLSGYLALYKTHRRQLLRLRGNAIAEHPESVATTWSVSIDKVRRTSKVAVKLLQFCAFLDPDAIPEEIIKEGSKYFGNVLRPANDFALNEAIRTLLRYSLIRRDPDEKLLSVHRLVQAVITDDMTEEVRKMWVERAVKTVDEVFPRSKYETWAQCRRYLSNALLCAELIRQYQLEISEAGTLLMEAGYYLYEQARYREAETFLQEAVRILEKALGDEDYTVTIAMGMLARIYLEQRKYGDAERLFQRHLQNTQKEYGTEHRETAISLHELARLYLNQGRFSEAEPLFLQALAIKQRVLGEQHPNTATTIYSLAVLYERQEKYEQAEEFYQRTLKIEEKTLGLQHPSTAITIRGYARFLRTRGRDSEAAALEKRIDQGSPEGQ